MKILKQFYRMRYQKDCDFRYQGLFALKRLESYMLFLFAGIRFYIKNTIDELVLRFVHKCHIKNGFVRVKEIAVRCIVFLGCGSRYNTKVSVKFKFIIGSKTALNDHESGNNGFEHTASRLKNKRLYIII